jgi:protein disulfide-isomerase-like protein
MRSAVLAALCLFAAVAADEGDLSSPVAVLTDGNFEEALIDTEKRVWMVEFYAPWCAHCKALAPKYEEAAVKVKAMRFAKVDATAHKVQATKYGVTGYPSLFWIRDRAQRKYRGGHSVEGFAQLAKRLAEPAVEQLADGAAYEAFLQKDTVVWLFGGDTNSAVCAGAAKAYRAAAAQYQDELVFAETTDAGVLAGFKAPSLTKSGCFIAKADKAAGYEHPKFFKLSELEGEGAADALPKWLEQNKFPLVVELNSKTFWSVSHANRKLVAAIVDPGANPKASVEWTKDLHRLALPSSSKLPKAVREQFLFGVMDGAEKDEKGKSLVQEFLSGYGVNIQADLPRVVVFDISDRNNERYYEEAVGDAAAAEALLLGIGDGTVTPRYQGMLGNLDKAWRWAKRVAPFLKALDFLPRFAFVAPFALLLLYGFLNMLCGADDEEEDDDDESDDAKKQD